MYDRWFRHILARKMAQPYVHILFGARQTGKSTLLNDLVPEDALRIDLSDPVQRADIAARPAELQAMCRALPRRKGGSTVLIDEAQTVPAVFDTIQYLYDHDPGRWRFILCGSSARRLRSSGTNLLPGRSILHRLYPLVAAELSVQGASQLDSLKNVALKWPDSKTPAEPFPAMELLDRLAFGALPGIVTAPVSVRPDLLRTYTVVHLEEEIRHEAFVRDWAAFMRFARLAAAESGNMINFASISNQAGISQPTVKAYYQLLEDMFVGFMVPAFTRSPRKNILSTPRFFMFDLGVRNAAAGVLPSRETVMANPGPLFEQWVGMELWNRLQYLGDGRLYYQKTRTGAEVDFIVERGNRLLPIEVKWTEHPTAGDARHLLTFLREHPHEADEGFIVCRCARPLRLDDMVTAVPWQWL